MIHRHYNITNNFSDTQVAKYKAVFREDQVVEYRKTFESVPSDALESQASLGRIVCKVVGIDKNLDTQFKYAIGKGTNCTPQDAYKIAEFKRPLEYHLDNLSLVTKNSKQGWSDSLMSMKIKKVDLVQVTPEGIHNIDLQPNLDFNFLFGSMVRQDLSPIILEEFQDLCISRFSQFSFLQVPDLQVVLHYLQVYPVESSVIIAPYIVSIVTLPIFLLCGYHLNKDNFFMSLFEGAIEKIRSRPFSWSDYFSHRTTQKAIIYSAIAVGSGIFYQTLHLLTRVEDLGLVQEIQPSEKIIDPLECYRFTGKTGENIRLFQSTTGGILVTVCDTVNGYRDIIIKMYINPWVDAISVYFKKT